MDFVFSQDLGKLADYHGQVLIQTKLQVKSRMEAVRQWGVDGDAEVMWPKMVVRWINRKQCSYPDLIEETKIRLSDPILVNNVIHLVDATGVGVPTIDFMRESGLNPLGIWITGGSQAGTNTTGLTVPKVELINALQLALDSNMIEFAQGLKEETLKQLLHEFSTFKEKKTQKTGAKTYEAWRESDHDDLILALAMAVWWILRTVGINTIQHRRLQTENDYDPLRNGL